MFDQNGGKVSEGVQKSLWEKEKIILKSSFSFSHKVFKRLVLQTRKTRACYGKGYFYIYKETKLLQSPFDFTRYHTMTIFDRTEEKNLKTLWKKEENARSTTKFTLINVIRGHHMFLIHQIKFSTEETEVV